METGYPAGVVARYQEAHALIQGQRAHLAMAVLREIVNEDATFAPAHNDLGHLYLKAGNNESAVNHFRQAWELTKHPIALKDYITTLQRTGQTDKAADILLEIERRGNLHLDLYPLLTECLYEIKCFPEISVVLKRWISLAPDDPKPRLRLLELPAMLTQFFCKHIAKNRGEVEELVSALSQPVQERLHGPFVTVGIPTKNHSEQLYVTLLSLSRQSYRNFEVLISDDSSAFGLEAEVRRIFPDLKIRYIRGPQGNLPANRACILKHSQGELIVMCDDKHYMVPNCLELLVDSMLQNPRAAIVSAVWPHPFENPRIVDMGSVKGEEEYRLDIGDVGAPENLCWKHARELFKSYVEGWPLLPSELSGGGCLIYRKSAVLSVGGFPKDCSSVSFREDADMSHRLYLAGFNILVQTGAVAYNLSAIDGGCREELEWGGKLVRDGIAFLDKLKTWRRAKEERALLSRSGSLLIATRSKKPSVHSVISALQSVRGFEPNADALIAAFELCEPGERLDAAKRVLVGVTEQNEELARREIQSLAAIAAITSDESIFYRNEENYRWFYLPELQTHASMNRSHWVERRETLFSENCLNTESFEVVAQTVFREIERIAVFGPRVIERTAEEKILAIIEDNFSDKPKRAYKEFIVSSNGRVSYLADDFIADDLLQFEEFQKRVRGLPPFFFHYGGTGDALLLLASILDRYEPSPGSVTIFSAATSPKASEEIFREFPEVGQLFLTQLPDDADRLTMLRYVMAMTSQCRGMGVCPMRSHREDWFPGIDITKSFGVNLYPSWVKKFEPIVLAENQVAIAPNGSGLHMVGGKLNSVPRTLWSDLLFVIRNAGYTPIILGTPDQEIYYPAPPDCINKRSYSFGEQMQIINGSQALIGADSWAKTFSALAGLPTIVFPPTYDGVLSLTGDASMNVFLKPWPNITLVQSTAEVAQALWKMRP